jgi:hypothetical protein
VNRSAEQLRLRTTGAVARHDRLTYQRDYEAARDNGSPRPEVGEPIEVASYLGAVISMARRVVGAFSEATHSDLFLRKHARKLTTDFVRAIYQNTPVNFDHLFCYALRLLDRDRVPAADFHRALYLAATDLADEGELRLHPSVTEGIEALVTGVPHGPLESVVQLATRQKILERSEDHYAVDRKALEAGHDFHTIRLKNMVQVIANELEPLARGT